MIQSHLEKRTKQSQEAEEGRDMSGRGRERRKRAEDRELG